MSVCVHPMLKRQHFGLRRAVRTHRAPITPPRRLAHAHVLTHDVMHTHACTPAHAHCAGQVGEQVGGVQGCAQLGCAKGVCTVGVCTVGVCKGVCAAGVYIQVCKGCVHSWGVHGGVHRRVHRDMHGLGSVRVHGQAGSGSCDAACMGGAALPPPHACAHLGEVVWGRGSPMGAMLGCVLSLTQHATPGGPAPRRAAGCRGLGGSPCAGSAGVRWQQWVAEMTGPRVPREPLSHRIRPCCAATALMCPNVTPWRQALSQRLGPWHQVGGALHSLGWPRLRGQAPPSAA